MHIWLVYEEYIADIPIILAGRKNYKAGHSSIPCLFEKSHFHFFLGHTILIPILTTRKDGKLYAQFLEKNWAGINGEMYST